MNNIKRLILCLLAAMLLVTLTACGSSSNPSDQNQASQSGTEAQSESAEPVDGKTLVVYYSASGRTATVAGYLADALEADLFELAPVEPYSSDDLDWTNETSRVSREHEDSSLRQVELSATTVDNWDSYDTVLIGYPIWWGIAAWPVDGFVAANDFSGKTVIPFCTSSSSELGQSGELLAELAGTGEWLEGQRFQSSVEEADVVEWANSLALNE